MQTITRAEAVEYIRGTEGRFFSLTFEKRTNPGEIRAMNARTGVKKHLKGGEAAYNFAEKQLISVFDMQKGDYRCIPMEGIREMCIEGVWVKVE
jgi:hypothetical protein